MAVSTLESKLEERNGKYYNFYKIMKEKIGDNYLDDIRTLYPWYTDHGIKHTEAILHTLSDMVTPENTSLDLRKEVYNRGDIPSSLSNEDLFVLLSASLWHDVGMLISRDDHARHLIKYTKDILNYVEDQTVAQTIYDVACAHGSNKKFDDCVNFMPLNFYHNDVNVSKKTLAALLRIADEISEDENRITKKAEVFEKIPEENKLFWEHAAAIGYSKYKNNKIIIQYNVDIDKAFVEYKYQANSEKKITLYMFIIQRICKIINELIICAPYFSSICRVDALNVTIQFQKQDNWICEEIVADITEDIRPFLVTDYDNSKQTSKFFDLYTNFKPDEIKRKIGV